MPSATVGVLSAHLPNTDVVFHIVLRQSRGECHLHTRYRAGIVDQLKINFLSQSESSRSFGIPSIIRSFDFTTQAFSGPVNQRKVDVTQSGLASQLFHMRFRLLLPKRMWQNSNPATPATISYSDDSVLQCFNASIKAKLHRNLKSQREDFQHS